MRPDNNNRGGGKANDECSVWLTKPILSLLFIAGQYFYINLPLRACSVSLVTVCAAGTTFICICLVAIRTA